MKQLNKKPNQETQVETQIVKNETAPRRKRKLLTGKLIDKIVTGLVQIGQIVLAFKTLKK